MSIEVKQLTINSTLQRNPTDVDEGDDASEKETKKAEAPSQSPCLDPEQIKAEVLAACRKLIDQAMNEKRRR